MINKFSTQQIGSKGEDYAVKYLKRKKYKIIQRNFRTRYGEIDIIAETGDCILFIEVKTRHTDSLTQPYEAVDFRKQQRLINTAKIYLSQNNTDKFCRFDVCEVYVDRQDLNLKSINYIEAAFEEEN